MSNVTYSHTVTIAAPVGRSAWQQRGSAVHVRAASAQVARDGAAAADVLTLVVDLHPAEDDETERITYEDAAFE